MFNRLFRMVKTIKDTITNAFNFSGTLNRENYWMSVATYFIFYRILRSLLGVVVRAVSKMFLDTADIEPGGVLYSGMFDYYSILLFPLVAATVRRLRDTGLSVWFIFLPVVNLLLCLKPSKKEVISSDNR